MQLSRSHKVFGRSFSEFPKSTKKFGYFGMKHEPWRLFVSETMDCKKCGYLNA